MTAYLVPALIAFAFAALAVGYWAVRGQRVALTVPADLERYAEPVDLAAFQALLDPANESFLRAALSAGEVRAFQRQRARVAAGYVQRVARNAALLTRFAELARASSDPQTSRAGAELADRAVQLRLVALLAYLRLRVEVIHPDIPGYARAVAGAYESLSDRAAAVAAQLEPASGLRCARALYSR
jgi:hypothetical protein